MKIKNLFLFGVTTSFLLLSSATVRADDDPATPAAENPAVPQSELDNLKAEWEAVRDEQILMIREKEDQLEKLKEEIFSKMKTQNVPDAAGNGSELEAQKAALQSERQKFFAEMNRQKESLLRLQTALDEKAKQLEAERSRFEQEKKAAAR